MKQIFLLLFLQLLLFSNQKITLQLDWKHQFQFAGFYAAKEQGYYEDAGLDVEIREFKNNINVTEEVLSNGAEFGLSSSSLILDKLQNKDVVLVASYFKQNALALVTSKDIKQLKDLKNKKIMGTLKELKRTSLSVMLSENQIYPGDYEAVPHEYNSEKFLNGEVDAMSVFITNELYFLDEQGIEYNLFSPTDFGIYSYDLELFSSKKFVKENPKLVEAFRDASRKGWEYAFAHKKEIVALIYKNYSKEKTTKALLYEADKTEKLFKLDTFNIGAIVSELVLLNTVIYEKLGLVDKSLNLKEFLNDYIISVSPSKKAETKHIEFSAEEIAFINEKRVIKIANEMDWAPFDYNEFGKAKGLSIEYIKLLFKKAGLRYEFVSGYSWSELVQLFENDKIDVMPAFYKDVKREKISYFSTPYYQVSLKVYALKEHSLLVNKESLKGKKIAVEESDASVGFLKKYFKDSQIIESSTAEILLNKLHSKKVDAVVCNPLLMKHYLKEKIISKVKIVDNIEFDSANQQLTALHVGVQKELPLLHTILQKVINSLNETEIQELKKKWIDSKIEKRNIFTSIEQNYLHSKNIKMCVDPDWMPFEKIENSKHIGMSADFFKLIEKTLGTKIELVETATWSESIQKAKNRECDIYSLVMPTAERLEYMSFTTPYLNVPLVLATKTDVSFVANFQDIEDKKVGIPRGYAFEEILKRRYPNLEIIEVGNIHEGLQKVKEGTLFGYIGTLASIGYMFQTQYTGELKIAGKFEDSWHLGIGVRNDDALLLTILQKAVDSIDEDSKRNILNKWIAIKYEKGVDYTLVWRVLTIGLIVVLLFIFWNRKLSKLNSELQLAKKKADLGAEEKANFLANMSHEIRTPMNSIVSMSYLIKETSLSKIQFEYVQKIEIASNNLLSLINDILDFSKMEAKKLEIYKEDFNLLEVLNNIENILKLKIDEKALVFKVIYDKDNSMHLHGDSLRISQVLTNLVSNAVKFTQKGKVELIVEKRTTTLYRFSVRDTGIGLSKEQMKAVFSSFTQADGSITRKYGGTGLGLSIAKELVDLMGGKIWVESVLGEGSNFIFEIEMQLSLLPIIKKNEEFRVQTQKKKTLIEEFKREELFEKLKEATQKRRPQLCEPILNELSSYDLGEEYQEIFENVKSLVTKYQFEEAREILNEK